MFDVLQPIDITAASSDVDDERLGREETQIRPNVGATSDETLFRYFSNVPTVQRFVSGTTTTAEIDSFSGLAESVTSEEDATIRARDARVALLARKYEGHASHEDSARIQILTQRLRKLNPRVTHEDVEQLGTMVGELEDASLELAAIRREFGLP